jgi:hypothetical protein
VSIREHTCQARESRDLCLRHASFGPQHDGLVHAPVGVRPLQHVQQASTLVAQGLMQE